MTKNRVIQIQLGRPVEKGSNEQAKTFAFSFEGDLADFEALQVGINDVIQKILWSRSEVKKEQAV